MNEFNYQHNLGHCSITFDDNMSLLSLRLQQWLSPYNAYACVIITDDTVGKLYAELLQSAVQSAGRPCQVLSFPAGELSKTRETKAALEDQLFALGCTRKTVVIACGGGVVLDMAGFIAATYLRGVPCFYLPTSLLAMVDASIGGKTAVNTPQGKNLIGTFTQPKAVYIDVSFLSTLPIAELWQGWSEMVKHAFIKDATLLNDLEVLADHLQNHQVIDSTLWLQTIKSSIEVKAQVVQADECERSGERQVLNFGHTVAHAIEAVSDYSITHGDAVRAGLWIESYLSYQHHELSKSDWQRIQQVLSLAPVVDIQSWSVQQWDACIECMFRDKKSYVDDIRCVLLKALGVVNDNGHQWAISIDQQAMRQACQAYAKELLCCPVL
ncbi:MAG TPA: 3-dehydroquinate synthase [Coxiellaceae bacterium]|nr:3-dehydroquinate synthase [Coxiellaceae bacterium]